MTRGGRRSWESRLARRYYDKLFKEFAIVDLSRASEGKVGMRWRTEEEVGAAAPLSFLPRVALTGGPALRSRSLWAKASSCAGASGAARFAA